VFLLSYNNKTYRIDDIDWAQSPNSKFAKGQDGNEISYFDYYKQVSHGSHTIEFFYFFCKISRV